MLPEGFTAPGPATPTAAYKSLGLQQRTHQVWSLEENARVFVESIRLYLDARGDEVGSLPFDKDDELAVDFVTAAANLRFVPRRTWNRDSHPNVA